MPLAIDPRPEAPLAGPRCARKMRFVTERDARTWLKGLDRHRGQAEFVVARMTVYRCQFHNCWHLGHKPVGRKPSRP